MNTGPTPDFQEVTEGSCNLSDTSTIAKAGVDCNSVTVQNQESGGEHTQRDLLDPQMGEGEADISDPLIYSTHNRTFWILKVGRGRLIIEAVVPLTLKTKTRGILELSKNLFWDLFRWAGVRVIRRSDELFDHTGTSFGLVAGRD